MGLIPVPRPLVRLLNCWQFALPDPPLDEVQRWFDSVSDTLQRVPAGTERANLEFLLGRCRAEVLSQPATGEPDPVQIARVAEGIYELLAALAPLTQELQRVQFVAVRALDEVLVVGKEVLELRQDSSELAWPIAAAISWVESQVLPAETCDELLGCLDDLQDWLDGGEGHNPGQLLRSLHRAALPLPSSEDMQFSSVQLSLKSLRGLLGTSELAEAWSLSRDTLPLRLEFRADFLRSFDDAVRTGDQETLHTLLTHGEPLLLPLRSAQGKPIHELVALLAGAWFEFVPDITLHNYIQSRLPAMSPACLDAVQDYIETGNRDALLLALEALLSGL